MDNFFLDAFNAVSGDDFEEKPVSIEEFVTSKDFLGVPPLSHYQYQMVKAMSQIYKLSTLISLYGEPKGREVFESTHNEIVLQLGKGSGKDYTSTIACCYVIYLLLCLKDPASYYDKPKDDNIHILNVAINAEQAKNVFFSGMLKRLKNCPWFEGRYEAKANMIEFDKSITLISGHAEREAFEGLNLIMCILDEISGFPLESNTGNDRANTAHETYKMYRTSVNSRFSEFGKLCLLSFPRFKNDYIQQAYDRVVAEKDIVEREVVLKIDDDLPSGVDGNEMTVKWEEDQIIRYNFPRIFALRRPTWEVNPTKKITDHTREFFEDEADALGRLACMPSDNTEDSFFKNKMAIDEALVGDNGVDNEGNFYLGWMPKSETEYFMHVDLSKVHDRCAVAVAHVDNWVEVPGAPGEDKEYKPYVVVDAIRWWKPSKSEPMDFDKVTEFIMEVQEKGFRINLVTFDRWSSIDTRNYLEQRGFKTDLLSVANKHYDDFLSVMYGRRLRAPLIDEFKTELRELRWIKGKVDHPRSGYKDLSDAVCGAIFDAVAHTPQPDKEIVDVLTLRDLQKINRQGTEQEREKAHNLIEAPKRSEMPASLEMFLNGVKML